MESLAVKTRFVPSPTGLLHLGNVRTALFMPLRAALTSDTHGPEMDWIWRLLGEERVRQRFVAAATLGKG
jgi:glutamyl/glutaminyl-tRNA synthetase